MLRRFLLPLLLVVMAAFFGPAIMALAQDGSETAALLSDADELDDDDDDAIVADLGVPGSLSDSDDDDDDATPNPVLAMAIRPRLSPTAPSQGFAKPGGLRPAGGHALTVDRPPQS